MDSIGCLPGGPDAFQLAVPFDQPVPAFSQRVSEGVLPHTPWMYRHLPSHLAQAREGDFPDLIDDVSLDDIMGRADGPV